MTYKDVVVFNSRIRNRLGFFRTRYYPEVSVSLQHWAPGGGVNDHNITTTHFWVGESRSREEAEQMADMMKELFRLGRSTAGATWL
jgi:hypothetical protein